MGLCACDKCPTYTDVATERIIDGKPYILCEECDSTLVCARCEVPDSTLFSVYGNDELFCEPCRDLLNALSETTQREAKP